MASSRWRPHPDLVIIGVKRGGTTSLFRDLERHPNMCPLVPSARRLPLRDNQKGVHYFDSASHRSEAWYRSHFASTFEKRRRNGFTAEASPYYMYSPLAARRAATTMADTRFVALLRDPVERTVSHWAEQTRNGVETLSLADALDAEADRVGRDAERLASGEILTSHAHEQQSYAGQSEYAASLQRWLDVAGPDRVHIAFSEDYYRNPAEVIDPMLATIEMPPMPPNTFGEHRNAAPRPSTLDAGIEQRLIERFSADVAAVSALVGRQPPWERFS